MQRIWCKCLLEVLSAHGTRRELKTWTRRA